MKKKIVLIILTVLLLAISALIYSTQEQPTPPSPMPEALATTGLPVITLSTPGQVYDGTGKSVGGFKIKANNVTIKNCTVYASVDYSFEVRANGLTVDNCGVYNNRKEGSVFDFLLPNGQAVTNTTITNLYADGDVGWGVTGRWDDLTMINATFLNVGKKSSSGKHVFYFKDVTNGHFENITASNVENSCIKVVGQVSNIYMKDVTCENTGESKDYGSALMIGEGGDNARTTYVSNFVLENFQAVNTFDRDVEVYDSRVAIPVTINGVFYPSIKTMDLPNTPTIVVPTITITSTATPTRTATTTFTVSPIPTIPTKTATPSCITTALPVYVGDQHVGDYCP